MAEQTLNTFELAPGIFFTEAPSPPPPPSGIPKSTGGIFGVTERGPVGEAVEVRSFAEWTRIFGDFISEIFSSQKHVKKAFQNGSTRLVFTRIVHYTDITDALTLTALKATGGIADDTAPVINASVADGGNAGDDGAGASGGTFSGFDDGTYTITVSTGGAFDGSVAEVTITSNVGSDTGPFLFKPLTGVPFAVGTRGVTLTLTDGGDTNLTSGDIWTIAVTAAKLRISVTSIDEGSFYNNVVLGISAGTLGVSGEFNIQILDATTLILLETVWENLSLDTVAANYFEKVINNDGTGSEYIRLTDTSETGAVNTTQSNVVLSGGDDGLTGLVKADFIGDPIAETGLEALGVFPFSLVIGNPDNDDTDDSADVKEAVDVFIQARHPTSFQVAPVRKGLTPAQAKTFMDTTLALDSPFYASYYPWIKNSDDDSTISPTGALIGLYGRFADLPQFGIHFSPAGIDANFIGVSGIERTVGPVNAGILNEARVNLIKTIRGRGVTAFGARTGAISRAADFKYIGQRLNTSFVEKFIETNTQWAVLRPNDTKLYQDLTGFVSAFLLSHFKTGALAGDTPRNGFQVICNNQVNTDVTRQAGLVVCRVGIRNKPTAEFIWFNIIQLASGGSTIAEAA